MTHSFYSDHEFWLWYVAHRLETVRVRYTHCCDNPTWYVGDLNITHDNGMESYNHKTLVCGDNHITTKYAIVVYADEHENLAQITMNIHARRIEGIKPTNHLIVKINNRKPFKWILGDDISNDMYYELKLRYS